MWFCIDDGHFSNHLWQIRAYVESEQLHETECCVVHHFLFIYWSIPMAMVIIDRMHVVWLFCRDFLARHIFKSRRCNQRRRYSHVCLIGIGWRYPLGPTIVWMVSGIVETDLQAGLLCDIIFPIILLMGLTILQKQRRQQLNCRRCSIQQGCQQGWID